MTAVKIVMQAEFKGRRAVLASVSRVGDPTRVATGRMFLRSGLHGGCFVRAPDFEDLATPVESMSVRRRVAGRAECLLD